MTKHKVGDRVTWTEYDNSGQPRLAVGTVKVVERNAVHCLEDDKRGLMASGLHEAFTPISQDLE